MKRCPLNSIMVLGRDDGVAFGFGALVDGARVLTHPDFTVADAIGPAFASWPEADAAPEPDPVPVMDLNNSVEVEQP